VAMADGRVQQKMDHRQRFRPGFRLDMCRLIVERSSPQGPFSGLST
jgi:hypothetical protein